MRRSPLHKNHKALAKAESYEQWLEIACAIDRLTGAEKWRDEDHCDVYHASLLREQSRQMKDLRESGRAAELSYALTHSLYRNLSDIQSPELYETALGGPKRLVTTYLDECENALQWLAESDAFALADKKERFEKAAMVFGRSALMLSGGATLGFYHLGVVKGLFEQGILPHVISGSSTGAMVAAGICVRDDDELRAMYDDPSQIRLDGLARADVRRFLKTGAMLRSEQLYEVLRHNAGDATFGEAWDHSGRVLCISVSPTRVRQKPRLLTPLTAPDVLVASAALASSALPGLFEPITLQMRDHTGAIVPYIDTETWVDGSIHGDLPKMRLSRLHNVNHFIVSQTNPHVLPVAQLRGGMTGTRTTITGLASSVARNQGSTAIDAFRRVSGRGTLQMLATQAHTVVSQDYRGDIDIHPRFEPRIYKKVLSNPTRDDLDFFIREGERAAWGKIAMIRDHTRISRAFDRCLRRLAEMDPALS